MNRKDRSPIRLGRPALGLLLAFLVGCGGGLEDPRSSPERSPDAGPPVEPHFEGTAGIVERPGETDEVVLLTDVRVGRHQGFDRVTFEFAGSSRPGHHLEYVDRPVRQCGSGHPVPLAGDGWLEVRMELARGHDEEGNATLPGELDPGLPVLLEVERTCDFEGVVTYVLGVRSPNRYRVLDLDDPTRLVVDVRHGRR